MERRRVRINRKLTKLIQTNSRLYFAVLLVFTGLSALYSIPLAVAELLVVLGLALYNRANGQRRNKEISKYLDNVTGSVDLATKSSMANAALPMVIFRPDSEEIIWTNEQFLQLMGENQQSHLYDTKLSELIPEFQTHWLMEGKNECPVKVEYHGHRFIVFGQLVRTSGRGGGFLASTYWVDVTEMSHIQDIYEQTRPVAAVLLIDNYEELTKNLNDNEKSVIMAEIDSYLSQWTAGTHGLMRRYQRERYLFVFEKQYLDEFVKKKFDILDLVHQVVNPTGINASLSIGVGTDGDSFEELLNFANLSIDMALSRGGDQAVIRDKTTFEFFGGRSKEMEKRTKVKSRVMANALSTLISDSSRVFIMGHKAPDNDCIGAAAGVYALCRQNDVEVHIIRSSGTAPSQELIDRLSQLPEYQDGFVSAQDALMMIDARTLVVVVDTNRPEQVQSEEVLRACSRVAVIDHHRRAATYIEDTALNFHEPYASSASELVTELLQYIIEPNRLLRAEAEALLAGIVLDTKNFTMRTGGRTFEAAAYLRRSGADTGEVKRLFQNDLAGTIAKYAIIQNAKLYREHIAVAVSKKPVGRVTIAQAADELLNIIGIDTSFVLTQDGEQVNISGRSMGSTNVQVILEKLGGGGNAAAAGGQMQNTTLDEAVAQLEQAIDSYLDG